MIVFARRKMVQVRGKNAEACGKRRQNRIAKNSSATRHTPRARTPCHEIFAATGALFACLFFFLSFASSCVVSLGPRSHGGRLRRLRRRPEIPAAQGADAKSARTAPMGMGPPSRARRRKGARRLSIASTFKCMASTRRPSRCSSSSRMIGNRPSWRCRG